MFIETDKNKILKLESLNQAKCISRFSDLEKVKSYYTDKLGYYSAFNESKKNLYNAYATPIKVYRILINPVPSKF